MKPTREFLGLDHASYVRRKVFLLVDALETDEHLFIRIERTRVYFDDVLAITYHQERGILFLLFTGIMSLVWAIPGLALLLKGDRDILIPGLILIFIAAMFSGAFLLRVTLQLDVICVFGRRTNSRMRFWFRKARAQEIYTRLIDQVRARQQKAAAAMAPPPPVLPEALSPPPPEAPPLPEAPPPPAAP